MKTRGYLIIMALTALSLSGCRKPLCYDHDLHGLGSRHEVQAEWEKEWERDFGKKWEERWRGVLGFGYDALRPEAAEGIRARVFTDGKPENEANLASTGGRLPMSPGVHDILFYNNDTEYITFHDEESSATAMASTRGRTRSTYNSRNEDEVTVNAPDQLYGAFIPEHTAELTDSLMNISVRMRPLVYTYVIHYIFEHGLKYVAGAKGALAGMAGGVYLQTGKTTDQVVTILFDDCIVDRQLGIYTTVRSFGVPDEDPIPMVPRENQYFKLELEAFLKNGKRLEFAYDVTDQVRAQPRGGVIVIDGIRIEDEEGEGGSGGFNPNVDGWGEFEDIILPI